MKNRLLNLHFAWVLFFAVTNCVMAHDHLAVGFKDANANNQPDVGEALRLYDEFGNEINPTLDREVHLLMRQPGERYAGYYSLDEQPRSEYPDDYFSFTAFSDGQAEAANIRHAASGSFIWGEISGVTGPAGASLGFWEGLNYNIPVSERNRSFSHTTPSVSFLTNQPTGNYQFMISEPLSIPVDPSEDPFGHIHNRGFTVTAPGDYYVDFTFYDLGENGPGDGPIHVASASYTFHFIAIPEPGSLVLGATGLLMFGIKRHRRKR